MKKEELLLFPAIRKDCVPIIGGQISVMRNDHDEHSSDILRIRELTQNLTPPTNACRTWRTLYEELANFIAELEAHIKIENEVLFPQVEA
jgi:regulator of cell morphogenesis and NO signaling